MKGQSEVIGLLIIVIILIFGAMIYIRFSLSKGESLYPVLRSNIEVNNLIKAVMKTNIENKKAIDLGVDCYLNDAACNDLRIGLDNIFKAVLRPNEDYRFVLLGDDEELINIGSCNKGIVSSYPIAKNNVFFEARLTICSKK